MSHIQVFACTHVHTHMHAQTRTHTHIHNPPPHLPGRACSPLPCLLHNPHSNHTHIKHTHTRTHIQTHTHIHRQVYLEDLAEHALPFLAASITPTQITHTHTQSHTHTHTHTHTYTHTHTRTHTQRQVYLEDLAEHALPFLAAQQVDDDLVAVLLLHHAQVSVHGRGRRLVAPRHVHLVRPHLKPHALTRCTGHGWID